jgi:hypothetical protein
MSMRWNSINCVVDDDYRRCYETLFAPQIGHAPLIAHQSPVIRTSDEWGTVEFKEVILFKLDRIIQSLIPQSEECAVIWCDVDLYFTKPITTILNDLSTRLTDYDIVISAEDRAGHINSGFFAAKCNITTQNFFKTVKKQAVLQSLNEQPIIEYMLLKEPQKSPKWSLLPISYWNLTIGFPIPDDVCMIHVNVLQELKINYRTKRRADRKMEALKHLAQSHPPFHRVKIL